MKYTAKSDNMEQYLDLLRDAVPGITIDDLYTPFSQSGIHSLDTVIIRDTLERYFGMEIADKQWYAFQTLNETLQYLTQLNDPFLAASLAHQADILSREHEIRLPQMANSALSENWLLREIGDVHWELLSRGLEQPTTEFTDAEGNRLYAAFVRISYNISPLSEFRENDQLSFKGVIKRFGHHAYFSKVAGRSGSKYLHATLATSFSSKNANDNNKFSNGKPTKNGINKIAALDTAPEFYTQLRMLKKGLIKDISANGETFKITNSVLETVHHTINPYYEINGAGLLYFAAYPMIADEGASRFMKHTMGIRDFDATYHTTFRDVFYFANCNADDQIRIELNTIEHVAGNSLKITTTLYRESDYKCIARILTIKQKTDR